MGKTAVGELVSRQNRLAVATNFSCAQCVKRNAVKFYRLM
jgi:hypothetical protein